MADLQPSIPCSGEDDPQFISLVNRAVLAELEAKAVHGLFVIRINNWFDLKWLNFSGIGRVAYGHYTDSPVYDPDTSLDSFHRSGRRSTFPPFTPSRVISQDFYGKDEQGSYVLDQNGPWVHASIEERSSANLHRRIATRNNSALFVWFGSNTATNGRGSLMTYRANGRIISSWYASFSHEADWRVVQTEGISRQHLVGWLRLVESRP
jgi:hypothetical protein